MLVSRRTIPRVAGATLVLGGCGDDGGADRSTIESAVADFCDSLVACDSLTTFYDSLDGCMVAVDADLRADLAARSDVAGPACGDALLEYYTCVAQEYAATCDGDKADDACIGETVAAAEACFVNTTPLDAAIASCGAFDTCAPGTAGTFADCVDLQTLAFAQPMAILEAAYGIDCAYDYLSYVACGYDAYAVACDSAGVVAACADEYDAYFASCY